MRTTIRVEDDLLERLKTQAQREKVSLTRLVNRVIRAGLQTGAAHRPKRPIYRERPQALGTPGVRLDKALGIAAALEDEETMRKLAVRK
jgi:hypothetical protein